MKTILCGLLIVIGSIFFGCNSTSKPVAEKQLNKNTNDTVRIANEELEYEIIIIDGGFNTWLNSTARRRGFYSQNYFEARNIPWVIEWNNRARIARTDRDRDLFGMEINYRSNVNYGYEVNYLLYNYLVYFQIKNNIRLGGFMPTP
ncbi:DUF6146 family protein [Flavobacterium pedocola]